MSKLNSVPTNLPQLQLHTHEVVPNFFGFHTFEKSNTVNDEIIAEIKEKRK